MSYELQYITDNIAPKMLNDKEHHIIKKYDKTFQIQSRLYQGDVLKYLGYRGNIFTFIMSLELGSDPSDVITFFTQQYSICEMEAIMALTETTE